MSLSLSCLDIAKAAGLVVARTSGAEQLYKCPRHDDQHPSLAVNTSRNVFLCGPCAVGGNPWQFLAFLGGIDPDDKPNMSRLLKEYGLTNGNGTQAKSNRKILATYAYTDENGSLLFEVVRFQPKDFRQRRPDGQGWVWNLNGVRRVPYHLPELLRATDVIIVEGEKDADNLRKIGLNATTFPGGAKKWRAEYVEYFNKDQHLAIFPDNDQVGHEHARIVATALHSHVASVKILELPDLPPKGDVCDWLEGKNPEDAGDELSRLIEHAPEWTPAAEQSQQRDDSSYIEFAPSFLAVEDPPVRYLVTELLPEQVLALWHGDPRTRKTWFALEIAIALATGTPPFELTRFAVAQPLPVYYSSQEDAVRPVRVRARALLKGRGIATFPDTLAFSIHKGIYFESSEWQNMLLRDIAKFGFKLAIFDPVRRFSLNVDKGPAEVQAVTGFLRRLSIETGASIGAVHHDVKPGEKPDSRRRGHKASGGDWFAASETPISFEQAGDHCSLVIPEDFKHSADPEPFTFRIESDDPRNPTWARLIGQDASVEEAQALAIDEKVLTYLTDHTGASGNAIVKACRARREAVLDALARLFRANKVDCLQKGPAKLWTLRRTE